MKNFKKIKKCRICSSKKLYKFLDLGSMPIPNGFRKKEDLRKKETKYELACFLCESCSLVQLTVVVNPRIMFEDYVYISATSKVRVNNFSNLAYQAYAKKKLSEKSLVVDIGSNDGTLLALFKNYNCRVLGVDPAKNLASVSENKKVPTEVCYFNPVSALKIKKKYGSADVITATNVIAHIDDLDKVFKGVDILLNKEGIFITEFPYLVDLIEKLEFDTIYHEHLSYFSLKAWNFMVQKSGFEIFDIQKLEIDGGAIRLTHRKKSSSKNSAEQKLQYFLDLENRKGFSDKKTYDAFAKKVLDLRKNLRELIDKLAEKGSKIVGYGAPAKGNVLTNFFDIGKDKIDYIVDSTPYKQGLFTPGMNIPIYSEERLFEQKPDYALILAWNFANEIIEKQKVFKKGGGKFIIPLPEVKII